MGKGEKRRKVKSGKEEKFGKGGEWGRRRRLGKSEKAGKGSEPGWRSPEIHRLYNASRGEHVRFGPKTNNDNYLLRLFY